MNEPTKIEEMFEDYRGYWGSVWTCKKYQDEKPCKICDEDIKIMKELESQIKSEIEKQTLLELTNFGMKHESMLFHKILTDFALSRKLIIN